MGSGQSARKLTISNEEEVGVIKVSNAIVQRLAQRDGSEIGESSADTRSDSPKVQHPVPPPSAVPPATAATSGQPVYYPELTVSALQMQQHMEQELKRQDQYWHRRLQNLEEGYQKINRILEDEYKRAVSETSTPKTGESLDIVEELNLFSRFANHSYCIYLSNKSCTVISDNKIVLILRIYSCFDILLFKIFV